MILKKSWVFSKKLDVFPQFTFLNMFWVFIFQIDLDFKTYKTNMEASKSLHLSLRLVSTLSIAFACSEWYNIFLVCCILLLCSTSWLMSVQSTIHTNTFYLRTNLHTPFCLIPVGAACSHSSRSSALQLALCRVLNHTHEE